MANYCKFLTKKDLTSGIYIPADVRGVLSFIANWNYYRELTIWYDNTRINIYQPESCVWTLCEATKFKSELIAANIVFDYSGLMFSSEKAALCIRRCHIK